MPDNKPRRKAVIVGINEYKDKDEQGRGKFAKLEGAENDAKDFKERLEDTENPEFNYDIHYLIGSDATCSEIRKALSDVFWKTEETCDIALFYFSGHGKEVEWYDEGYIAPYDMLFDDPFVCGIKMSDLRHVISNSPHKCTITILDCCYSGLATKSKGDFDFMAKVEEHLNYFGAEGRIILASSGEDQKSREITVEHEFAVEHDGEKKSHPHGAFTYSLLEGIDNGKITLNELNTYVIEKMEALSEKINYLKNQKCKFLMSGDCVLENTVIARSHEEKNRKSIQNKVKAAVDNCESGQVLDLIAAVDEIQDALKIHPKNQEALEVKKKITQALKECKNNVDNWIWENTINSSVIIRKNLSTLEYLADNVSFEGFVNLSTNKRDKVLLTHLCRVSAEEITRDAFDEKIRQYVSPSSPLPTKKEDSQIPERLPKVTQTTETAFSIPEYSEKIGSLKDPKQVQRSLKTL